MARRTSRDCALTVGAEGAESRQVPSMTVEDPMMFLRSFMTALAIGAALLAPPPARAQDTSSATPDKAAIEAIIRDYILSNPEVVQQALQIAEAKRLATEQRAVQQAILGRRDVLVNDPDSPVIGNPEGDVTIVEFMDYRCGFCRRAAPVMTEVLDADPKLRLVFKEFPILGPDSVAAARVALAAHRLDPTRYGDLHHAIFASDQAIDEAGVLAIAGSLGYDVEAVKASLADPAIDTILTRNEQLAQQLGIRGTPTFIIGTTILPGFSSKEAILAAVADERVRLAATGEAQ